jgi:hypothetical protein
VADRLLVFANAEVKKLLKEEFVTVAADDWYQRRRKDKVGEFFAKVVDQSPRKGVHTKQGHYIFTATGKLLGFSNNRGPEKRLAMIKDALSEWDKLPKGVRKVDVPEHGKNDQGFYRELPKGGQIVKVYTRCFEERSGRLQKLADNKIGNLSAVDHLWLRHLEVRQLGNLIVSGGGPISNAVSLRIAKFHLRDNTRGEPRDWKTNEVKEWSLKVDGQGKVSGNFLIGSADGQMGYQGKIEGMILVDKGRLAKFDLLVLGKHWGNSRYTQGARPGKAPMGQVFRLSDGKRASDRIPPQGIRWAPGYWNPAT